MANVIAMCDLMVLINSNVMYNSRIKLRFVNPIASACNCVKSMSTLGSIHTLALHSMLLKVTRLACHRPVQRDRWIAPIAYTKETKMHNISNYGRWKKGFWGMRKGSGDRHFTHCPRCFVVQSLQFVREHTKMTVFFLPMKILTHFWIRVATRQLQITSLVGRSGYV